MQIFTQDFSSDRRGGFLFGLYAYEFVQLQVKEAAEPRVDLTRVANARYDEEILTAALPHYQSGSKWDG